MPLRTTAYASAGKGPLQLTASVVKTAAMPGQRKSTEGLRASTSGSLGSSLAAADSLPAAPASSSGSSRHSVSGGSIGTQAELQRGSARSSLPAMVDRMELQRPRPRRQARLCPGAVFVDTAPCCWLLCWSSAQSPVCIPREEPRCPLPAASPRVVAALAIHSWHPSSDLTCVITFV